MAKEKKSLLKIILIIVAILFIIFIIAALFSDDEYDDYTETDDTDFEYTDDTYTENDSDDNSYDESSQFGEVEYVVKDPVGVYRKFNSRIADASSEEISELANGQHFINQAFDFTEYATTINDSHGGNYSF